jgi:ATP-dependent protease ClpP protease subunit
MQPRRVVLEPPTCRQRPRKTRAVRARPPRRRRAARQRYVPATATSKPKRPAGEIAVVGKVDDWGGADVAKGLPEAPAGGNCVFSIDSAGGSAKGAPAVPTMLRYRRLKGTAMVIGECSSAALLLFAACCKRLVTTTTPSCSQPPSGTGPVLLG